MGVFKLDLMTLLVLFVVLSVIVTMTAGTKESEQSNDGQIIPKTSVSSVDKVGTANSAASAFRVAPAVIPQSRFSSKTFTSKTWN